MTAWDQWSKLDRAARSLSPLIIALFMVIITMVPLHLNNFGAIMPSIGLMAVFYWSIYRPDLFGPGSAFSLGFVYDTLSGAPLGLNSLLFLIAFGTLVHQRQLFLAHSFLVLWWGYAILITLVAAVSWGFYCLINETLIPIMPALFQTIAGLALFPPIAWIFHWVQRGFLDGL